MDYGTICYHSLSDLYYLHMKFAYLPTQAVRAQLHGISPRHGKTWNAETLREIKKLIPCDTKLRAVVKGIRVTMVSMHRIFIYRNNNNNNNMYNYYYLIASDSIVFSEIAHQCKN